MKPSNKDEDLFHLFVQYRDKLPYEASFFPYFELMDISIRKQFNQLKKQNKIKKYLLAFDYFWRELTTYDRVKFYCNWVVQLRKALYLYKNSSYKLYPYSLSIQDQIYIRKQNLFNNWEKKIAKLTPTHLHITGKKVKEYELKFYYIRKSRGRDTLAWVLKPIVNGVKPLHCYVGTQAMYDYWFYALTVNINNQRVEYFLNSIKQERANPGTFLKIMTEANSKNKKKNKKTKTEIMIEKQMSHLDNYNLTQVDEAEDYFYSLEDVGYDFTEYSKYTKNYEKKYEYVEPSNPNIFRRLAPDYDSIMTFTDTPFNSTLIHCDSEYRIYELPHIEGEYITLKMFTVLPFPKSLVFEAIVSESKSWNEDIDMMTIKTKISSYNSALIYYKNKSHGILYRERDFLFLRHCFSISNMKQRNTFIIDKSIDSIHHPPFMSLVRAEKKLIWGLVYKYDTKECILIVEGWISGGGYMNSVQNKEMTLKFMRKILNLKGFLKQLSFSYNSKNTVFKEDWIVDINKVYRNSKVEYSETYKTSEKGNYKNEVRSEKQLKYEKYLAYFMIRTYEYNKKDPKVESYIVITDYRLEIVEYVPPKFAPDNSVIIPQDYLKVQHILAPKEKEKKPKYAPHIRGHHIWKGYWQIIPTGGLAYIDEYKMKEQKKILTYIIKRIGKNIFSGKGILNISLPVDIFCVESNIERLAMSFGYFPYYLYKAVALSDPIAQFKYIIGSGIPSSLIYLTMYKPFNPILGYTFQTWVDGCPIYFYQISHHPPVAAFILQGRGYRVSGNVYAKMDLSINSGTGNNEGVFKVYFYNGNTFYFTTPAGMLQGLTYGDRKLNLVGKSFYWDELGHFLEIWYNPAAKTKGFFTAPKGEGDEKLADYFYGHIKLYEKETIKYLCFKRVGNRDIPIIPKSGPSIEPIQVFSKVYGRWNQYIKIDGYMIYNVDEDRYYALTEEKYPLPSHCNYREDIVYRRLKNFVLSQYFKYMLEEKQRNDRKLRAKFNKSNTH